MKKNIMFTLFVSISLLFVLFPTQSQVRVVACSRKPSVLHDPTFTEDSLVDVTNIAGNLNTENPDDTVILSQNFTKEKTGARAQNWTVTEPLYGDFIVDNRTYFSGGKSAKFVDNSTEGSPCPYKTFPEQNTTIVVTFAIRLNASSGIETNLTVYVDNGSWAGANICFANQSGVGYFNASGFQFLRTYSANQWYKIKMIMNIPNSMYNIYIDDRLEAKNAKFNKPAHEIHRIAFGEARFQRPTGHIDEIMIRRSIRVPEDYPTIQEAIDAASPGNTISVFSKFTSEEIPCPYYEHIHFRNKRDLRLIGEDRSTTIIDGRFDGTSKSVISLEHSHNITISEFTVKNGDSGGIFIGGSNNTIIDNIITSNLVHGIHVEGENNTITDNVISNNKIGVNCTAAEGNILYNNKFICNTHQAFDEGSNTWDNGYPSGGNYWSDYNGTDVYSGPNQDQPVSDGIGDTPYNITDSDSQDNYPLFLIRELSQIPEEPSYDESVNVTATTLEDVQVEEAILSFKNDSEWHEIPMSKINDKWNATIPPHSYSTTVEYKVKARNICALWVTSANFSYKITDTEPPKITKVEWKPEKPTENDAVNVHATVSEPKYASGVDKVLLFFNVDNGPLWNTAMDYDDTSEHTNATIPRLPSGAKVVFYIEAYDKVGNSSKSESKSYTVKSLPPPPALVIIDCSWVSDDHCDVNSTQTICFHAIWGNNASAVQKGTIYINGTDYGETNSTGWISFTNSSSTPTERIWTVTGVDCNGTKSYTQTALNPSVIWDRIKIVDGNFSKPKAYVGETVTVWFTAEYEYDHKAFGRWEGTIYVNGSEMGWSVTAIRWEHAYSLVTPGNVTFQVSGIYDRKYGLTVVGPVRPLTIVVDRLVSLEMPWWLWIVVWASTTFVILALSFQFVKAYKRKIRT